MAREGGFSKASRVLHVAQPAITKMVKNLEANLGYQLFDRSGRNIRLTKLGNDIFRKCEIIFSHVDDIKAFNHSTHAAIQGPLNLGAAEPIATHLIPIMVKKLLHMEPGIYPQVIASTATEAVRLVVGKKLEFALLFHAPDLPENVEIRNLYPVRYKLVVAANKVSSKDVCSSFIGSREVDDVANKVYPTLTKLRKKYSAAEIRISTNALTAHRQMVLDGLGVSILPEYMVRQDLAKGRLDCLLKNENFIFNMKLVCLKTAVFSRAAEAFIKVMAKEVEGI